MAGARRDDDENRHRPGSDAVLLHKVELIGEPHERRVFEGRRRHAARRKADALMARELMTAPAVTTRVTASLVEAARLMEREHVKRLPVTDDTGQLVGIVSRGDLLKVHLRPDGRLPHGLFVSIEAVAVIPDA